MVRAVPLVVVAQGFGRPRRHLAPLAARVARDPLVVVAAGCAADDPVGIFAGDRAAAVDEIVTEDEQLDVDLAALEEAAADLDGTDEPVSIDIPDDALDLSGMDQVALDIQDNAFTQRVVVVSAGTEITWTNQGRNEHNVRPAVEGAFEPISTLDLAEKGDSASLVFETPGDFPYFCSLHGTATNGQTGRVIVVP